MTASASASTTQHLSHLLLDKETDARFWAQTGYKPGQKLDMANPTDAAMAKVWADIYAKVAAEDRAGRLVLTYNHPHVEQHLDTAQQATAAAAAHVDQAVAASAAGDTVAAAHHQAQATTAAQIAASSTSSAAAVQPPTVSPEVAHAAAIEAHANNGGKPDDAIGQHIAANPPTPSPQSSPSSGAPAVRGHRAPSHPDLATPGAPIPPHPQRRGAPQQHRYQDARVEIVPHPTHQDARVEIMTPGPVSAADYIALSQATNGAQIAAAVHDAAASSPRVVSTIAPADQATIREAAKARAASAPADAPAIGVVLSVDGRWEVLPFPSTDGAMTWYGQAGDIKPAPFKYIAVFDRTGQYPAWPDPVGDSFGDAAALMVNVSPSTRETTRAYETVRDVGGSGGKIAIVGAVAVTGVIAALAAGRRRH